MKLLLSNGLMLGIASILMSCSLNRVEQNACKVDSDCAKLGGNLACASSGFCEERKTPKTCTQDSQCGSGLVCLGNGSCGEGCANTQACVDQIGDFNICRQSDRKCVGLLSKNCKDVLQDKPDDYKHDQAFFVGSVLPTTGDDIPTGLSAQNGIELARSHFQSSAQGLPALPGGSGTRPIVHIACTDNGSSDTAVESAKHLVNNVQVPAIIGAAYSGITIRMTTEVTIPAKTFVISPSATSAAITDLQDDGLVWRTSPSDVYQSAGLAAYAKLVEQDIRTTLGLLAADPVKAIILNKSDAYGAGLADALAKQLELNGAPALDPKNKGNFERFDYGNPDDPQANPTKYNDAVNKALNLKPHVISILGTTEMVNEIMAKIETGWTETAYRPLYLLPDGGLVTTLWDYVKDNDALRKRITGSVPGTASPLFNSFASEYSSKFTGDVSSPDIFGAAGGYDSMYMLAFAAASIQDGKINGEKLRDGMKLMVGGNTKIQATANDVNKGLGLVTKNQAIDFDGASGTLEFDVEKGEAPSDIVIWCLGKDSQGNATSGSSSGLLYDAANKTLKGTIATLKTTCKFAP